MERTGVEPVTSGLQSLFLGQTLSYAEYRAERSTSVAMRVYDKSRVL
jgi:hypothetical protein